MVDIDPGEFYPSRIVSGQFVQNRFKTPAVSSPWCRKIEEHCTGKTRDLSLERFVCDVYPFILKRVCYIERCFTFPADRSSPALYSGNPVFCATLPAGYYGDIIVSHCT